MYETPLLCEIGSHTVPDVYFECSTEAFEGVCVYFGGLSEGLHGDRANMARDHLLRSTLDSKGYKVVVIPHSELEERGALTNHCVLIARAATGKTRARQVQDSAEQWWSNIDRGVTE